MPIEIKKLLLTILLLNSFAYASLNSLLSNKTTPAWVSKNKNTLKALSLGIPSLLLIVYCLHNLIFPEKKVKKSKSSKIRPDLPKNLSLNINNVLQNSEKSFNVETKNQTNLNLGIDSKKNNHLIVLKGHVPNADILKKGDENLVTTKINNDNSIEQADVGYNNNHEKKISESLSEDKKTENSIIENGFIYSFNSTPLIMESNNIWEYEILQKLTDEQRQRKILRYDITKKKEGTTKNPKSFCSIAIDMQDKIAIILSCSQGSVFLCMQFIEKFLSEHKEYRNNIIAVVAPSKLAIECNNQTGVEKNYQFCDDKQQQIGYLKTNYYLNVDSDYHYCFCDGSNNFDYFFDLPLHDQKKFLNDYKNFSSLIINLLRKAGERCPEGIENLTEYARGELDKKSRTFSWVDNIAKKRFEKIEWFKDSKKTNTVPGGLDFAYDYILSMLSSNQQESIILFDLTEQDIINLLKYSYRVYANQTTSLSNKNMKQYCYCGFLLEKYSSYYTSGMLSNASKQILKEKLASLIKNYPSIFHFELFSEKGSNALGKIFSKEECKIINSSVMVFNHKEKILLNQNGFMTLINNYDATNKYHRDFLHYFINFFDLQKNLASLFSLDTVRHEMTRILIKKGFIYSTPDPDKVGLYVTWENLCDIMKKNPNAPGYSDDFTLFQKLLDCYGDTITFDPSTLLTAAIEARSPAFISLMWNRLPLNNNGKIDTETVKKIIECSLLQFIEHHKNIFLLIFNHLKPMFFKTDPAGKISFLEINFQDESQSLFNWIISKIVISTRDILAMLNDSTKKLYFDYLVTVYSRAPKILSPDDIELHKKGIFFSKFHIEHLCDTILVNNPSLFVVDDFNLSILKSMPDILTSVLQYIAKHISQETSRQFLLNNEEETKEIIEYSLNNEDIFSDIFKFLIQIFFKTDSDGKIIFEGINHEDQAQNLFNWILWRATKKPTMIHQDIIAKLSGSSKKAYFDYLVGLYNQMTDTLSSEDLELHKKFIFFSKPDIEMVCCTILSNNPALFFIQDFFLPSLINIPATLKEVLKHIEKHLPEKMYEFFLKKEIFKETASQYCIEDKMEEGGYKISLKQFTEILSDDYKNDFNFLTEYMEKYVQIDIINQQIQKNCFNAEYALKHLSLPLLLFLPDNYLKEICIYQVRTKMIDKNILSFFIEEGMQDIQNKGCVKEKLMFILTEAVIESYFLIEKLIEKNAALKSKKDFYNKIEHFFNPEEWLKISNVPFNKETINTIDKLSPVLHDTFLDYYFLIHSYKNLPVVDINLQENLSNKKHVQATLTYIAQLLVEERSNNTDAIKNYLENAVVTLATLTGNSKTPMFYKILFLLETCIMRQKEINSNNFDSCMTHLHALANKTLYLSCTIYSKKLALAIENFLPACESEISIVPLVKNYKKIIQNGIHDTIINKKYQEKNICFLESKYLKKFLFIYEPKRVDNNRKKIERFIKENNQQNINYLNEYVKNINLDTIRKPLKHNLKSIHSQLMYIENTGQNKNELEQIIHQL